MLNQQTIRDAIIKMLNDNADSFTGDYCRVERGSVNDWTYNDACGNPCEQIEFENTDGDCFQITIEFMG